MLLYSFEFIYCLEGEVEYLIGSQKFLLTAGDSLLFKATEPHSWYNPGELPVKLILVFETDRAKPVPHRL